jgi:predicted house-cleaning NTP pyrophosphatase (Maf/HAM1 superfamily)
MVEKGKLSLENFILRGREILTLPYPRPVLVTSSPLRREIGENFGYPVLTVSGWVGDERKIFDLEDKTQKEIYEEQGGMVGITPWRRTKNSTPFNLELAADKAKGLVVLRQQIEKEFFQKLNKKIKDFRFNHPHKNFSDKDIREFLIATDSEIKSLYLILNSLQDFYVVDSAWTIQMPDGFDLSTFGISDPGGDGRFILHKPKDNIEGVLKILSKALKHGGRLTSTSGVVQVHMQEDGTIVTNKKMVEVDFGEITQDLINIIAHMMEENSHQHAGGFSVVDLFSRFSSVFLGRKVKIRIEDYNQINSGLLIYNHQEQRTEDNGPFHAGRNPSSIKEFEITLTPENFLNIIALSLGIEPL